MERLSEPLALAKKRLAFAHAKGRAVFLGILIVYAGGWLVYAVTLAPADDTGNRCWPRRFAGTRAAR